jgi:peptide/nickel transport system ATP-binding protein/oligopeptide transport system ATP-binding protein
MRKPEVRRRIQVVFQNPNSSLDPRMRVGDIIAEPLLVHKIGTRKEQAERVNELLSLVGLEEAHADRLPFEFSGGQRQRIAIARALAPRPDLLVCDEPLTALDVSVQAQILNLLQEIQHREKLSYLFIAHDLSVVRQIADRVAVMYLGRVIETGSSIEIFARPHHPYTAALLSAISYVDPTIEKSRERIVLRGALPSPLNPPPGCVFHTRCWKAQEICKKVIPEMETVSGRTFACHFPENSDLL